MATEASFTRRETSAGVEFSVVPARFSILYVVVFSLSSFVVIALVAGIGAAIAEWLGAVIGFAAMGAFLWFVLWRHFWANQQSRKAVTLLVDQKGLRSGDSFFVRSDIAELNLREGSRGPDSNPIATTTVVVGSPVYAGAMAAGHALTGAVSQMGARAGNALRERQAMRSLLLTVRTKQNSKNTILAGGLTPDCAQSLMNDLGVCLGMQPG